MRRQLRVNSSNRNSRAGVQRGYLLNDDPNSSTAPIVGSSHPAVNSTLSAEEKAAWRCSHCYVSKLSSIFLIVYNSAILRKHQLYSKAPKVTTRFVKIVVYTTKKMILFQSIDLKCLNKDVVTQKMLNSQRKRSARSPLFLSLKNEGNLLLLGTNKGLIIFALDEDTSRPRLVLQRERLDGSVDQNSKMEHCQEERLMQAPGGIGAFDIAESSNLFCLVAGGKCPKFTLQKVILWDDAMQNILLDIEFSSPVKYVSFKSLDNRIFLFVLFTTKIIIYQVDLPFSCTKIYESDMYWNEFAAFGVSNSYLAKSCTIAFPARNKGQLHIVEIDHSNSIPFTSICSGHDHAISCIAVSKSGHLVATTSTHGTLIRIWHAKSGSMKYELRRGTDEADIYSMVFDPAATKLCVASDKGTVHIFNLELLEEKKPSISSAYLPKYFSSDWSFAFCSIPYLTRCIVKFKESRSGMHNTILIACDNGNLYTLVFDPIKGGEASVTSFFNFL